ncbi:MAG TPA: hypothetical protein VGG34_07435 [Opitutaceae bacterium]|jgi:cytochrome c553
MKRLLPLFLAGVLIACAGCHMFSKKKKKPPVPKPSKHLAADVEKEFMQRWIDKRTGDLAAQGMTQDAARAQAVAEYKKQYSYTETANQAK